MSAAVLPCCGTARRASRPVHRTHQPELLLLLRLKRADALAQGAVARSPECLENMAVSV